MVADTTIKKGYNQTELGVIPEDWEVKELGELAEVKDGTHQTPKYFDSGIPFYSVESVTNNDFTNTKYISESEHKLLTKKFKIEEMDILMTRIGSIGDCKLITWRPNASFYVSLALLKLKNKLNAPYIYHFSKTSIFKKELEDRSLQWAIPKKINLGEISKVKIYIPKELSERTAIATVLSDTDALIEHLNNLIAKKKAIKQGAMQQLLTGKKRLPGFSGEWQVKTFGEIFKFLSTGNNSRSDLCEYGEEVKYIHYGDIHTKWRFFLDCSKDIIPSINKDKVKNLPLLENGDLVMADASEDYDGLGISVEIKNIENKTIVAGLHTLLLRGDKTIVADGYKGYIQSIKSVQDSLIRIATGISVYGISKNNLKTIQIPVPPLPEQQAIAQILSDMDTEIEALEQKHDKYKALKQGMMQQLLTGKIRIHGTN